MAGGKSAGVALGASSGACRRAGRRPAAREDETGEKHGDRCGLHGDFQSFEGELVMPVREHPGALACGQPIGIERRQANSTRHRDVPLPREPNGR